MIFYFRTHILFKIDKSIAEIIVGSTRFFLVKIKIATHMISTPSLIIISESANTPAGKIIILATSAANVE